MHSLYNMMIGAGIDSGSSTFMFLLKILEQLSQSA